MAKFQKIIICIIIWFSFTLFWGYIGAEWSVRDVPQGVKLWAGDGIGILLYGTIGLFYGALGGLLVVIILLLFVSKFKLNVPPEKK